MYHKIMLDKPKAFTVFPPDVLSNPKINNNITFPPNAVMILMVDKNAFFNQNKKATTTDLILFFKFVVLRCAIFGRFCCCCM